MSRIMWTITLRHLDGRDPVTFVRDDVGLARIIRTILSYRAPGYTLVCVKPGGDQEFTVSFK